MLVFEEIELMVDERECPGPDPGPAVEGRGIDPPTSDVLVDIVVSLRLPKVACLWCPRPAAESGACLRPFTSNGPGAIVFILWSNPPLLTILGLTGAYIGSTSRLLFPVRRYSGSCLGRLCGAALVGKGGKAQSRFEERSSGDGGLLAKGAVALRRGLPNGDRWRSIGDIALEGEPLLGVNGL